MFKFISNSYSVKKTFGALMAFKNQINEGKIFIFNFIWYIFIFFIFNFYLLLQKPRSLFLNCEITGYELEFNFTCFWKHEVDIFKKDTIFPPEYLSSPRFIDWVRVGVIVFL